MKLPRKRTMDAMDDIDTIEEVEEAEAVLSVGRQFRDRTNPFDFYDDAMSI